MSTDCHTDHSFDVVVVGAANAGPIAAISAQEPGSRVLLLEAAPVEEGRGNRCVVGRPFRGRFATGEVTGGVFAHKVPSGGGLTRGAVFGRIAGEATAEQVRAE